MPSSSGKGRDLGSFINRAREMQLIQDAFDVLVDSERLLSTPIIDFFGVGGIGKTSILRRIENICTKRDISHIWLDASASTSQFVRSISRQMKKYAITTGQVTASTRGSFSNSSAEAIKELLAKKPPVVVLLDSVDSEQQSDWIEMMLRDVIDDTNLCVILASKQKLSFERDWSMARKLTTFQLRPLGRDSSELYLRRVRPIVPPETRKIILEWTRGYPLAMNVMVQAIGLYPFDFAKDEDQRKLVGIITRRVIDEEILARVEPAKLEQYREGLVLLSFPRHFNLHIMQELFARFAPSLVSDFRSKLAYMALPTDLNHNTNVLRSDPPAVGMTVDQAVRNIFLLQQRIERPAFFYEVHEFLAQKNKELVPIVTGTDCMRVLRECLYHSVYSVGNRALPPIIEELIQNIGRNSSDEVIQFSEEFAIDEELREALGSNVSIIDAFVRGI
jgi:hypothetical protein